MAHRWKTCVALAASIFMAGCATQAPLPANAPQLRIVIDASAAWPMQAVQQQISTATRRYAQCGIDLTTQFGSGGLPSPFIRFVPSLPPVNGKVVEGRAYELQGQHIAEIAWSDASGTALDHKQTLAHELAHVLGLRHTPLHSINLMSPHGCELCSFTPRQCEQLRQNVQHL